MYYYIIDQGNLPVDKFERLQTETLGYLAEFKISGEAGRVTPLRSISDLVETASQRGAKTLVACGSDSTFNLMVAALKGRDFTLGYIPYEENSYLATILGLDSIFTGAKTIAARRIERVDMAKLSGNYFLG
jgi:diacylglycerol kinase family enzyme